MKRMVAIFLTMALLMTGCSSNTTGFHVLTSFFDNFTSEQSDSAYIVKGTVHKEDDENAVITHIRAENNIEISITGTMKKRSGADTELVYVAPDGTETKIADNSSETFEMTLSVVTGDGTVKFKGEPAVCDFEARFELLDEVSYNDL